MDKTHRSKAMIAASLKALIADKDFDLISVSDIARRAAITRRTFYNHFKGKQDLVDWIYEIDVLGKLVVPTHDTWGLNIYRSLSHMYREPRFYQQIFTGWDPAAHWGHRLEFSVYAFKSVIKSHLGERAIDEPALNSIAEFYAIGYVHTLFNWAQSGMKEPPEVVAQRLVNMVDHGIYRASDHAGERFDPAQYAGEHSPE